MRAVSIDDNSSEMVDPEARKKKRVLWLINHTTLREFEVPLLLSLGYEVYTPKLVPAFILEWSGSIDYQYDSSLSIPQSVLDRLNQHNFYQDTLNSEVAALINQYFDAAICIFNNHLLKEIVKRFEGNILLRAFGIDKETSYSNIMGHFYNRDIIKRIHLLGKRFWFSQAYANLVDIEPWFLKSRCATHPIGLPQPFYKHENTWNGKVKKILFFCSRISHEYYAKIYRQFKQNFGDMPHVIAGNQTEPVADKHVVGFQTRETIETWFRDFAVMFYHSEEPRHLHYHPLEAMIFGMPIVYMRGGMLEILGGKEQDGACATYAEAKEKIRRILDGDEVLINKIRKQQLHILEHFAHDRVKQAWEQNFTQSIMRAAPIPEIKPAKLKIAVLALANKNNPATLELAKNIAKSILKGSIESADPIQIVFSYLDDEWGKDHFSDLKESNISIRPIYLKPITLQELVIIQRFSNYKTTLFHENYFLPADAMNNLNDCDKWLVVPDALSLPLAPMKPYGIIFSDSNTSNELPGIQTARVADYILAKDQDDKADIMQRIGIAENKIHIIPQGKADSPSLFWRYLKGLT